MCVLKAGLTVLEKIDRTAAKKSTFHPLVSCCAVPTLAQTPSSVVISLATVLLFLGIYFSFECVPWGRSSKYD